MSLDLGAIRRLFSQQKPPVLDSDWDEAAYLAERMRALQAALESLSCEITVDGDSVTGDRVTIDGAPSSEKMDAVLRQVLADVNAWRRALRPSYFARYRAWRSKTGSPIAH